MSTTTRINAVDTVLYKLANTEELIHEVLYHHARSKNEKKIVQAALRSVERAYRQMEKLEVSTA